MEYFEVEFFVDNEEYISDLLSAALGEIGFESFALSENGLTAYIQPAHFSDIELQKLIANFEYASVFHYKITKIKSKNWNEEWEKNYFEPIVIGNECVIHSSFHINIPKLRYDIVIDPKMAFGTGHHESTRLVVEQLLKNDLTGKNVLDMGCGTAVLAVLAMMLGAKSAVAVDIDDWCTRNAEENIALNNITGIEVVLGGAEQLEDRHFDVILANINRNILLNDMKRYAACLEPEEELYMSGFYVEDIPVLEAEAKRNSLSFIEFKEKNNWAVVKFVKQ
ncbi:MAG: 50S ribosomal protein L11 methyltransferase [Prevotellaceae bacterium]|jgi:ribosomal protein L11 methyltransferase|nr:50S ribosomal protein L11 methyltransferase [Prevotellaceae bacterium]